MPGGALVLNDSPRELEHVKSALSALAENFPAIIFMKDAESLRFELFNVAAEQFLGVPRQALLGNSDADFFPSDQVAFFSEKDRGVLHERKVLDIPREPIDTVYGRKWLHTRKIPVLDKQGGARYLLGISLEVSRRRDSRATLRRLHAELEQRVATLGHCARGSSFAGNQHQADPSAADLQVLYAQYGQAIFAHCRRLLGSAEAGEDATQEVVMRALGQAGRWPPASELRPWIFRIATNYCLNELRRRRVRSHCASQLATALPSNLEDCLVARSEMDHLLERLPQRTRDVARLTYVEGLAQEEVAAALGISRRTVVSCLTQLRSSFYEDGTNCSGGHRCSLIETAAPTKT